MSPRLAGRKAIITGANRGLGLAVAAHYLAEGADVALGARDALATGAIVAGVFTLLVAVFWKKVRQM